MFVLKSFEVNKINLNINHFILFYGKNEGLKNEALNFLIKDKSNIYTCQGNKMKPENMWKIKIGKLLNKI